MKFKLFADYMGNVLQIVSLAPFVLLFSFWKDLKLQYFWKMSEVNLYYLWTVLIKWGLVCSTFKIFLFLILYKSVSWTTHQSVLCVLHSTCTHHSFKHKLLCLFPTRHKHRWKFYTQLKVIIIYLELLNKSLIFFLQYKTKSHYSM